MAFEIKSLASYAFKVLLGRTHTGNNRDLGNESIASAPIISAQRVWGQAVNPTPSDPSNFGIVSAQITLRLTPVSGTLVSYTAGLDGAVPGFLVGLTNPLTGNIYGANDRVGNIIPQSFGDDYRPILRKNGVEVPPLDQSDWFLDAFAGVVTQENDGDSPLLNLGSGGTLDCYLYIGKSVETRLSEASSSGGGAGFEWQDSVLTRTDSPSGYTNGSRYLLTSPLTGSTVYNPDDDTTAVTTIPSNYIIEWWDATVNATLNEGWVTIPPSVGMFTSIDNEEDKIVRYNGSSWVDMYFERTYPTSGNKAMTGLTTVNDGDIASVTPLLYTPTDGSYVEVYVNGNNIRSGNNTVIGRECWFASVSATTSLVNPTPTVANTFTTDTDLSGASYIILDTELKRVVSQTGVGPYTIVYEGPDKPSITLAWIAEKTEVSTPEQGHYLIWFGQTKGYELDQVDRIDLNYVTTTVS